MVHSLDGRSCILKRVGSHTIQVLRKNLVHYRMLCRGELPLVQRDLEYYPSIFLRKKIKRCIYSGWSLVLYNTCREILTDILCNFQQTRCLCKIHRLDRQGERILDPESRWRAWHCIMFLTTNIVTTTKFL